MRTGGKFGVGSLSPAEDVSDHVDPHGAAHRLAPANEQFAAPLVLIGQRLAIAAAPGRRPELRHLHETVPQAVGLDTQIMHAGAQGE